jgi:hypothetical protein
VEADDRRVRKVIAYGNGRVGASLGTGTFNPRPESAGQSHAQWRPGPALLQCNIGMPPVVDPLAMRVCVGFRGLAWWWCAVGGKSAAWRRLGIQR